MKTSLSDLIECIEYGTKLHIGVIFFGKYGGEGLMLPNKRTVHAGKFCMSMKKGPKEFSKCLKCRQRAIKKAFESKSEFSGFCTNGVFEFTRPVVINNDVAAIIFIGNIFFDTENKRVLRLRCYADFVSTMEKNFETGKCQRAADIIEEYIRSALSSPIVQSNTTLSPLIINLKNYIDANIENNISVEHVAKIFHYNEKYIGRVFKKEIGVGIKEYINDIRLEYAKKLLRENPDTVINISARVGYNNVTYFNRLFKQKYKISPSECRQNITGSQK